MHVVLHRLCQNGPTLFISNHFPQVDQWVALTVNSILGLIPPPNRKKNREKNGKCNQYDFLQLLPKSSWTTFKTIFETLSALGACHVTITGGVVYKKSMIFKVFGVYLSISLIFLHEIFFGSKILPSSCDKHQKFNYGCSSYPGNEAQSPGFGRF